MNNNKLPLVSTTYTQANSSKTALSVAKKTACVLALSGLMTQMAVANTAQDNTVTLSARAMVTNEVVTKDSGLYTEKMPAISEARTSQYTHKESSVDLKQKAELLSVFSGLEAGLTRKEVIAQKANQPKSSVRSQNHAQKAASQASDYLYVHDAAVTLSQDEDNDGYYSKMRVDFDVDSAYLDYFDVYAEMYIRKVGNSDWTHYHSTDVFEIYSDRSSDEYSVSTIFHTGIPTDDYEVLIDIYEYGYSNIEDTYSAYDDYDLGDLPLEDKTYENYDNVGDTYVNTVQTEIFVDNDNDGFYREFKITFDADTEESSTEVFARLSQRMNGGSWEVETETANFTLTGDSASDTQVIEGSWTTGYSTGYYDFRIELIDANTNEIVDDVSSQFSALLQVPLEDANRDTMASGGNNGGDIVTTSRESGGGSWSLLGLALLGLFARARARK